ncbi:heme ABC exporter ATP-binding protein CcmA [candidate division KSB1 bacterium]|nr:heme ABC exporter ATP-binding protein CcmA [candidate division KSB1 bacterium]
MIELIQIGKRYGWRWALKELNLHIHEGECTAFMGANGAGKTTLLKIIAALTSPSHGQIRIEGQDPHQNGKIKKRIGFAGHQTFLYGDLTVEENLAFYSTLYGIPKAERRIEQVLEQVGLKSRRQERVRSLSRGLQQRLSLARAVLHNPPVLLLDEPFSGLDLRFSEKLKDLIKNLNRRGTTILLTTHELATAKELCTRLLLLQNGHLQLDESPAAFPTKSWFALLRGQV